MSIALDQKPTSAPARISIESMASGGILAGIIGILITLGILFTASGEAKIAIAGSYLFAWVFWLSITLGCFGFTILYHVLRGKWMLPPLRLLEAGGGVTMLLVMAALFLPVLIPVLQGKSYLYQWVDPVLRSKSLLLQHKAPYLNVPAWTVRFFLFFGSWIAIAAGFKASTMRQEKSGDLKELVLRNNYGAICLVFFFLSTTFAAIDWVMSLDWTWYSTMYGVWSAIQMGIGAFSLCVMILCVNRDKEAYKKILTPDITRDLGNILFVLTMLWAYTSFSQFLIIWSGNLPETNTYYIERSHMGWNIIGLAVMIGQYFVPFVALLTPRNRKLPRNLGIIAGWMFFFHLLDTYQYVLPAIRQSGPMPTGWDILALVSIGVLWLGVMGTVVKKFALLPSFDLRLEENGHGH